MQQYTKQDLNRTIWMKPELLEKQRKWHQIDAAGKILGKIAVEVAKRLIGKTKAHYADSWDAGDFVIVQNVDKLIYTGNKGDDKNYFSYSGYKGNVKSITLSQLMKKNPEKVLWFAVRGMLPKNRLRDKRMKRLKMFTTPSTKYDYFNPVTIMND